MTKDQKQCKPGFARTSCLPVLSLAIYQGTQLCFVMSQCSDPNERPIGRVW